MSSNCLLENIRTFNVIESCWDYFQVTSDPQNFSAQFDTRILRKHETFWGYSPFFLHINEDFSLEGFIHFISTSLHIWSGRHHIVRCYKLHGNHIRVDDDYKSAEKTVIQTFTLDHISPCRRISKHTFLYFNSASRRQYSNISWTASLSSVRRSLRSSPCDPASL